MKHLLALLIFALVALAGAPARACPEMVGGVAQSEAQALATAPSGHSVEAGDPCRHESGAPLCGGRHACCALALALPAAPVALRLPRRISYLPLPMRPTHPAPHEGLDKPPKRSA